MRILDWLHSRPGNSTGSVLLPAGKDRLEVAGEFSYQPNLRATIGRRHVADPVEVLAILVPEQDNDYDRDAVSVWVDGRQAGHLGPADARQVRPGLLRLTEHHQKPLALRGRIGGAGAGALRLVLDYDRAEFGLPPRAPESPPAAAPEAKNAYEPAWRAGLSADPAQRLSGLRDLLLTETDVISRHYVFDDLEETLYEQRGSFPSALRDFDITCKRHDAEMAVIVPAMVAEFGEVRLLGTYYRAASRYQEAGNPSQAMWWLQRGVERCGNHPSDGERSELGRLQAYVRAAERRSAFSSAAKPATTPLARPVRESVPDPARHTVTENFEVPG